MVRTLNYEYHDAGVTGVIVGPRREITLKAELDRFVAVRNAVVQIRFGGITNFAQAEQYFTRVIQDARGSYLARIDRLMYDESVPSTSRKLALRVELDGYGEVQIHCQNVTEEESAPQVTLS